MPDPEQERRYWRLEMLQAAILDDDADTLFCLLTDGHPCLRYINPAAIGGETTLQLFEASIAGEEWEVDRLANESSTERVDQLMVVLPSEPPPLVTRELLHAAVARARKSLLIVASRTALRKALATPDVRIREDRIADFGAS
jgi:hypothetical protein